MAENLALVYVASGTNLAFSVLANLIVPISASKLDYANFRLLVLYANYAGFFHLGLLNGLYLIILGQDLGSLNWHLLKKAKSTLIWLQVLIIPAISWGIYQLNLGGLSRPILIASALGWVFANLSTFYTYLLQATSNFRFHTAVTVASRVIGIVLMSYFVFTQRANTPNLIIAFLLPLAIAALFYEIYWRKLSYRLSHALQTPVLTIPTMWRRGISLYVANIGLSFMFSLGSLWVSLFFKPIEFADFAFAYGFTSVTYMAIDGLALAVAPLLARNLGEGKQGATTQYTNLMLIWFAPAMYWVTHTLVDLVYREYASALPMALLFTATLPFTAIIRGRLVAIATASGQEGFLLRYALISLAVIATAVALSFYIGQTIYAVAVGWSISIGLTSLGGAIASVFRLPQPAILSDGWLSLHALAAASLLLLLAHQLSPNIIAMAVYLFIALSAVWLAWQHGRLQPTP